MHDPNTSAKEAIQYLFPALAAGLAGYVGVHGRLAALYGRSPDAPFQVYDPHGLVGSYRDVLRQSRAPLHRQALAREGLLIGHGSKHAADCPYIAWLYEPPVWLISDQPINKWLELAAQAAMLRLEQGPKAGQAQWTHLDWAGSQVIAQCIREHFEPAHASVVSSSAFEVTAQIVEQLGRVAMREEEGQLPRAKLVVSDCALLEPDLLVSFADRPDFSDVTHVRKLLSTASIGQNALAADGERVLGVVGQCPAPALEVGFYGERGAEMHVIDTNAQRHPLCTLRLGSVSGAPIRPNRRVIESVASRLLGDAGHQQPVAHASWLAEIIAEAAAYGSGCTLVVEDTPSRLIEVGHRLEAPLPIRDNRQLAAALSTVDGALLIDWQGHVHAFGVLLDGLALEQAEDRSRGARYNSALRYTAMNPKAVVFIVSEDGPIDAFRDGVCWTTPRRLEHPTEQPVADIAFPTLHGYLGADHPQDSIRW